MNETGCPSCNQPIPIVPTTQEGDWVNCPGCEADLQVVSLAPPG